MRFNILTLIIFLFSTFTLFGQSETGEGDLEKIKHANPVFDDLTTELGARTGENELNVNFGYRKLSKNHHVFLSQLEYEIAPLNNWGIEVLFPYTVYFNNNLDETERPGNRMEFFQWGTQYTFLKDHRRKISMAVGFRNILETQDPNQNDTDLILKTATYNPYIIFAKNWEDKYFFLFSGGIEMLKEYELEETEWSYPITTAFHYQFSNQDHYIGVELNKEIEEDVFEMYIRPQLNIQLSDDFSIGVAWGIPVNKPDEKWMVFLRLAYEFN